MNDLFEVKSPGYSLRNHVKVLQPRIRTTTYGLENSLDSYTGAQLWHDLLPLLSDVEEIGVFKSSLAILREDTLDPTFTYRQLSNMRRIQNQNLNDSRITLQLPLPNPLKPGVKSRMKM